MVKFKQAGPTVFVVLSAASIGFFFGSISGSPGFQKYRFATNADAPRASDTPSWKSVYLYRGGPKDPKLDSDSTSQRGQDLTIADIFEHKRDGRFLDLAANHAIILSNSMVLEQKYGWKGLCIEPNPVYTPTYSHRTCRLIQAVVGPTDDLKVEFNFAGVMGGVMGFDNRRSNKTDTHYTVSIAKILQDFGMPGTIDYLSLDIEGAEAWAFESFPWHLYTFRTLTVERPKRELRFLLEKNDYAFLCYHGNFGDELWVHASLANYAEVVANYKGRKQCRDKRR
jgi:hypothetical protein